MNLTLLPSIKRNVLVHTLDRLVPTLMYVSKRTFFLPKLVGKCDLYRIYNYERISGTSTNVGRKKLTIP